MFGAISTHGAANCQKETRDTLKHIDAGMVPGEYREDIAALGPVNLPSVPSCKPALKISAGVCEAGAGSIDVVVCVVRHCGVGHRFALAGKRRASLVAKDCRGGARPRW